MRSLLRGGESLSLAGIDDTHYYRVDNIEKAASDILPDTFSILLSHSPEVYRHAAHAGFDLLLTGYTHGGQICLPGSVPITLSSGLPRRFGLGTWRYDNMIGYSVSKCLKITLHDLLLSKRGRDSAAK